VSIARSKLLLGFSLAIATLQQAAMPAVVSKPRAAITRARNIIVWQRVGNWLVLTEDALAGRTCYYYDPFRRSRLVLKKPQPGAWIPLGSAIKWLMLIDRRQGLDRLIAHDVDWHASYIAYPSSFPQVGVGMVGNTCIFGQYRAEALGKCRPVNLLSLDVKTGLCAPFFSNDCEMGVFAHDGDTIVYRAVDPLGQVSLRGIRFDDPTEFTIALGEAVEPSVCRDLVAWAVPAAGGWIIKAANLVSGEIREITSTRAASPCPEAGNGFVCWLDSRNAKTTGVDIYGYDWASAKQFVVNAARGDQLKLRVCGDLATWSTGAVNYQTLWTATVAP